MLEYLACLLRRFMEQCWRLSSLSASEQYPGESEAQLVVFGKAASRQPGSE